MLILVYSNVYQSIPVPTLADSPITAVFLLGVQYERKCILITYININIFTYHIKVIS